jgi:photosystem II stability/assembly factor-like uncharacterized protein
MERMPTLYAAYEDTVLRGSPDADPTVILDGAAVECIAASGGHVFVGTFDDGLLAATDDDTWESVLPGASVTAVEIDPLDAERVYVGTEPSRLYRSEDAGESWSECEAFQALDSKPHWRFPPRPETHHVRWIERDPTHEGRLYAAIEAGALVRSPDRGDTWTDRVPSGPYDTHGMTTHSDRPDEAWVAAGDGHAHTTDGGETWTWPEAGLDRTYCWSTALDPANPDVEVLSAATGPRAAHSPPGESVVFRRTGDEPFESAMDGLPGPDGLLRGVLASGREAGELFAATNHGLYRTPDAGRSWTRLHEAWWDRLRRQAPSGLAVVD